MVDFDGFAFDPDSGELRRGERRVKLHPQPAQVLALLVRRHGEVVSREDIREELWGDETFVDYDLGINSCIRQIRIALGDDAESPRFVQTIPRKGYRFVANLESPAEEVSVAPLRRKAGHIAVATMVLVSFAALWLASSNEENVPPPPADSSIAVLRFDNLSGEESLDWLRTGLMDMLVTDLARLTSVDVVGTERVVQVLRDVDALEATVSESLLREVGEKTGAGRVILGSFMKAGENIRINVRVQDVRTGGIVTTASAEAAGESEIFSMVDELSQRVRTNLALLPATRERDAIPFAEYATSSIEAYRYLIEGHNLLRRSKSAEALVLYQRALEEDPEWARAVQTVSLAYSNLGREKEYEEYARRALELAERENPRDRYAIEGWYYAGREETYAKTIQAYRKHIELTKEIASNHILARRLFFLERVDEAIDRWEIYARTGLSLWMVYDQLANAYAHQERFDEADQLLEGFLSRYPDRAEAVAGLGDHFLRAGNLAAAREAYDKADALDPARPRTSLGRFSLAVLRESWREAEAAIEPALRLRSTSSSSEAMRGLALLSLYRGDSAGALEHLDRAAVHQDPGTRSAAARAQAAHVLLERGEAEPALELARMAQREGKGNYPEWEGLFYESIAAAQLNRAGEALGLAERLRERTESIPTEKERRRRHHLLGELALARGDVETAIEDLNQAEAKLLPRGFLFPGPGASFPPHVPIWFSLARASLEAGHEDKAAHWFEKITRSGHEHIAWPIPYVRSFYFLGRIRESRREMDSARASYRRFYELWKDGDLDRDRIAEARSKL